MNPHYFIVVTYTKHTNESDDPWAPGVFGPFASESESRAFVGRLRGQIEKLTPASFDIVGLRIPTQVGIDYEVDAIQSAINQDGEW